LFRTIGRFNDMRGRDVSALEEVDAQLVDQAFDAHRCVESRAESEDGRVWIRGAIPLHVPPTHWRKRWLKPALDVTRFIGRSSTYHPSNSSGQSVDGVLVLVHNATETVQRQRELNVKSAIIQEVHHRVKNNLQTIAAILRIQARRCTGDEAKQHLTEAVNRVLSMSVIHEFLSQDEHRPINVRDVCQRVATQVTQVAVDPERQIEIRVTGPNIRLPASQATPTALVVNELILNAVEHGLNGRQHGHSEIQLRDKGNAVEIAILDDGNGLPKDFVPNQDGSLGLQIVQTLVTDDLKGSLRMESVPSSEAVAVYAETPHTTPDVRLQDAEPTDPYSPAANFRTQAVVTFPKRVLNVD
jgi:two-component sensor histidine kinase